MNNNADISIIGAGPAGALTAYLLGCQGFKVNVFEKHLFPVNHKICGEYLCPAGHKLLQQLNLEDLLASYPKIYGMNIYSPRGLHVDTIFPNQEFGHAISREKFDHDLIELSKNKNVSYFFGIQIQTITSNKDRKIITVSDGKDSWHSTYLIGADGRQSIVGKWLNVTKKVKQHRIAIHAYLKVKPDVAAMQGEMHLFNDGSYCGLNPVSKDYWNFSVVCDGEKIKEYDSIKDLVLKTINHSKRLKEVFDLQVNSSEFDVKVAGKITNPISSLGDVLQPVVLVGDAAGFVDPLTGEGIYHALLTAKTLSDQISKYNKLGNYAAILNGYEKSIKNVYRKKELVNYFFQWLIHRPSLCDGIARFFQIRPAVGNAFIGLIGNIYTPGQALKMMLMEIMKKRIF